MDLNGKVVYMCPRVYLYKIPVQLDRKNYKKITEWKVNEPNWTGRLRIIGDSTSHYQILFENRANLNQPYGKCLINEYPTDAIELLSDSGKHVAIQLEDKDGHVNFYGLVFDDRNDCKDFRLILKNFNGSGESERRPRQLPSTSSTDTLTINKDFELKFFRNYPLELAKLSDFPNNFMRSLNRLQIAHTENLRQFYDEKNNEQLFHLDELFKRFKIQAKEQVNHVISPRVILNGLSKEIMQNTNTSSSNKKRTATLAEISIRHEEDEVHDDEDAAVPEAKPNKSKKIAATTMNGVKKKLKKKASSKKGSLEKLRDAKKASTKPASKKQRLSGDSLTSNEEEVEETARKMTHTKKQQSAKLKPQAVIKVSDDEQEEVRECQVKVTTSQPSIVTSKIPLMGKTFATPSKVSQASKPPINEHLASTAKKRPMTRAAGKVMQMVNMVEQKLMKNTCLQPSNSVTSADFSAAKTNRVSNLKTIRSSIEQRKLRHSHSKLDAKRKSVKKAMAFIRTINETQNQSVLNVTTTKCDDVSVLINENVTNMKQAIGLAHDLLKNPIVQSQYKIAHIKASSSNVSIKYPDRKLSFNRFHQTPSKPTKNEIDDKKKAELLAKEKKEQERLTEIEREKQAKIEETKKKREEKMKQIKESKAKRQEEEEKRREEAEAKAREIEENKKKLLEEKRREEAERARLHALKVAEEKKRLEADEMARKEKLQQSLMNSVQKQPPVSRVGLASSAIKKPLETTFTLNTPAAVILQNKVLPKNSGLVTHVLNNQLYNHHLPQSYAVTPLQEPIAKPRNPDNYDVSDLRSDDETDDEEDPSKPIPLWARDPAIFSKAKEQCLKYINYTKIFRTSSTIDIKLEEIFKTRRKKFNERSSSAIWNTPPIWTTGINGEESFRKLHQY